jgi:DNA-binding cell septation regulator SpoVG
METFDIDSLEIQIFPRENGQMVAQAKLTYGIIEISGYRIMRSKQDNSLFIQPPSYQTGFGKWKPLVFFNDPTIWQEIQKKISEEYKIYTESIDTAAEEDSESFEEFEKGFEAFANNHQTN